MNLKKNEMLLLYGVAALVVLLIVPRVIFGPFAAKLSGLTKDAALAELHLKKGTMLAAKKDDISLEYEKYASYFSIQGFSDEESVANFLKEVEKIGRSSGLIILDMKPQKETKSDKFSKQYQINIKADGNMQQLVKFLYELQSSSVLFSVEKMTVAPKSEESSDMSVSLTVVGVSFL